MNLSGVIEGEAPPPASAASRAALRPLRARLIFNASSGRPEESAQHLADILAEMQRQQIQPEVYMVRPHSRVGAVVEKALERGLKLIVVAGGDGTVDSVAGVLAGRAATLGIIPTGTRNNVALSLGIPSTIPEAVALLRTGRRLRVDVGQVHRGRASRWFLEAVTLGLLSDLYPAADDIQHGQLARIGELLAAFVSAIPARLKLTLDGGRTADPMAHMVLIANMPYLGPNFQVAPGVSYRDGRLDVFVFTEMDKLDLMAYVMQSTSGGAVDARIHHYRVRQLTIEAHPAMAVLADGVPLGPGRVTIAIRPRALKVMAGTESAVGRALDGA